MGFLLLPLVAKHREERTAAEIWTRWGDPRCHETGGSSSGAVDVEAVGLEELTADDTRAPARAVGGGCLREAKQRVAAVRRWPEPVHPRNGEEQGRRDSAGCAESESARSTRRQSAAQAPGEFTTLVEGRAGSARSHRLSGRPEGGGRRKFFVGYPPACEGDGRGIPLPPPKAFWIGVSEHEKDRCYEERWRVLRRVPQGVHALAAAHPHPGSGTGGLHWEEVDYTLHQLILNLDRPQCLDAPS
ncbi:hypothetical protein cypCar_00017204 [Cyprinus carpio]|nr:hypothetical protein cypCar_00017204 [Cyprinus carpio]